MTNKDSVLLVVTADLVANPEAIAHLQTKFSQYDVHQQLLERLTEQAVALPRNKYAHVYFSGGVPTGGVVDAIYDTLVENGTVSGKINADSKVHFIISGFQSNADGTWVKKANNGASTATVQLRRPQKSFSEKSTVPQNPFKRAATSSDIPTPPSEDNENDLIDEDELISNSDIAPAYNYPAKCDPGPGKKRRRACKDCTCGLKEAEEAETEEATAKQSAVLLKADDIAEIDFTVPGKAVGGCGSCALGDAFRCDGCPYLGLPPFKPGEVVSIDQFGDDF